MIPISVIVMTKNESGNLPRSLPPLIENFDEVFVVDSNSTDNTVQIAKDLGAEVVNFTWNGQYPKKKQWCIDHLPLKHDWVFLCDADEAVGDDFITECRVLDFKKDGYFVSSKMIWNGTRLNYGQRNNKLCLFNKNSFHHPVVDDLDIASGWEVEGHYQPIYSSFRPTDREWRNLKWIKTRISLDRSRDDSVRVGQIKSTLSHTDMTNNWIPRHEKYIAWEAGMMTRNAFPKDPVPWREYLKKWTRVSRLRPYLYFLYGYIFKCGFLDGRAGLDYALKRFWYYRQITLRML